VLEVLLRCLYFQKIGNDKFAITSAFKSIALRRTDNYRRYSVLKSFCDSTQNMYFLGDMLSHETQPPFIDEIHYSPHMNRMIAGEIFKRVQAKLIP
jgi:hypothetical protein